MDGLWKACFFHGRRHPENRMVEKGIAPFDILFVGQTLYPFELLDLAKMSQAGLKPATLCLEGRCSDSTELLAPSFSFLSRAFLLIEIEWISRDSNPDLTVCRTVALPDLSY
jgi:hypothetical protein